MPEKEDCRGQQRDLGFVDDDNWVADDWVTTAYQILATVSRLGAVGNVLISACQVCPPAWFDNFHSSYTVLTYTDLLQMSQPPKLLPTVGLCVRKKPNVSAEKIPLPVKRQCLATMSRKKKSRADACTATERL
jgi:hypothetical protein